VFYTVAPDDEQSAVVATLERSLGDPLCGKGEVVIAGALTAIVRCADGSRSTIGLCPN
jgi:hypothetical protein